LPGAQGGGGHPGVASAVCHRHFRLALRPRQEREGVESTRALIIHGVEAQVVSVPSIPPAVEHLQGESAGWVRRAAAPGRRVAHDRAERHAVAAGGDVRELEAGGVHGAPLVGHGAGVVARVRAEGRDAPGVEDVVGVGRGTLLELKVPVGLQQRRQVVVPVLGPAVLPRVAFICVAAPILINVPYKQTTLWTVLISSFSLPVLDKKILSIRISV